MSENFGRVVEVQIGQPGESPVRLRSVLDDGSRGLTLAARATYTSDTQDNVCSVTAHNLAPSTVSALQRPGAVCRVLAGYRTAVICATGTVLQSTVEGPERAKGSRDYVTSWQITDGGTDVRTVVVSQHWTGGVSASTILRFLAAASGLAVGQIRLGTDKQYNGYAVWGTLREEIVRLVEDTDSNIVVQDFAIEAWPQGEQRRPSGAFLSSDSGLLGVPKRQTDGRWTFPAQLLPGLRPGDAFRVSADEVTGIYIAEDVEHDIQSRVGPFRTTITGRAP